MNTPSSNTPSIGSRKKARRIALQALYGWTLTENELKVVEADVFKEHAGENFDKDYFRTLLYEIPKHLEELHTLFSPYLSRKLEEMGWIELNVLRIATYELRYRLEIPYRVIINEALELTKTFGAIESFKFVNGVLDKLAHDIRPESAKD